MELLKEEDFHAVINGKETRLFTLRNKNGCVAQFTNYGARWLSMWVPDKNGKWDDVILGFDNMNGYLTAKEKYYGAMVGRVCGRIGAGQFSLNDITYSLSNNDIFGKPVKNHLHGGFDGFSFKVWSGKTALNDQGEETLEMTLFSEDGEEGYPGNLKVKALYTLGNDNSLRIYYSARTDKPTIVNFTSHPYFNLNIENYSDVLDHILCVDSESSLECNDELIPTGNIISIKDTPLDFAEPRTIGSRINKSFPGQLLPEKGYVVSYILKKYTKPLLLAARVKEKESGRMMEVYTDQPCIHFYNAWLFDGSDVGKKGQSYLSSSGFALEAQGFPDAPNHSGFQSIVLLPGEEYQQVTIYRFLVK